MMQSILVRRVVAVIIFALFLITIPAGTWAGEEPPQVDPVPEPMLTPFFVNVTDEVGLSGVPGFRLSLADVNGDGYEDIFIHVAQNDGAQDVLDKQYLYLNVPGPASGSPFARRFIDYTTQSGIRSVRPGTNGNHSDGAVFADVDNDGDLDLFRYVYVHTSYSMDLGRNELLLNDGDGHFSPAPGSTFHTDPIYNTAGAVFLDYDRDGNIDLFLGNWYRNGSLSVDQLYRGHGDGTFSNTTSAAGIGAASSAVYAVSAGDYNGDGWPDLFVPPYSRTASGSQPILWENNGNGTFSQVQGPTGYALYRGYGSGVASFGSMPWDYDNDGDLDFFEVLTHGTGDGAGSVHSTVVTNINGVFSWDFGRVDGRALEDPNLSHHGDHYASWLDYDLDGRSDVVLTECGYSNNRLYLFHQDNNGAFAPVTNGSGLEAINVADLPSHNVMPVDYDHDGDEDLLVGFASGDGIQLWRNDAGVASASWLTLALVGGGQTGMSNRSAIGARVQVVAGGQTLTREVFAGNGQFAPQMPLAMSFGLASASIVDSITIDWPNAGGSSTLIRNVPVNRRLVVEELAGTADCVLDLTSDAHTCSGITGLSFVLEPQASKAVLRATLDPVATGYTAAVLDVDYGAVSTDWTVNIGDSATNNGGGGDARTQSNDSEMQVLDGTLKAFGSAGVPVYPLVEVPALVSGATQLELVVSNERLAWSNHLGMAGSLTSPWLYALAGQPDSEGPVNYDIYAGFNRTIYASYRDGTGVEKVRVQLLSDPAMCDIDLVSNTHTCDSIAEVSFVIPPSGGRTVLRIDLDPTLTSRRRAIFDVTYGASPVDWTVNIGDSPTNNGGGGDSATQSNDAELQVLGADLKVFGKDGTPYTPLAVVPALVTGSGRVSIEVSNEHLGWNNYSGEDLVYDSQYLYALNGQPDSEGPVNYEVYAGFNRVIHPSTTTRVGSGVTRVRVILTGDAP